MGHYRHICQVVFSLFHIFHPNTLTLVIAKLGGDEAIIELFHAIQDVGGGGHREVPKVS